MLLGVFNPAGRSGPTAYLVHTALAFLTVGAVLIGGAVLLTVTSTPFAVVLVAGGLLAALASLAPVARRFRDAGLEPWIAVPVWWGTYALVGAVVPEGHGIHALSIPVWLFGPALLPSRGPRPAIAGDFAA